MQHQLGTMWHELGLNTHGGSTAYTQNISVLLSFLWVLGHLPTSAMHEAQILQQLVSCTYLTIIQFSALHHLPPTPSFLRHILQGIFYMHFDSEVCINLQLLHPILSTRRSVIFFTHVAEEDLILAFISFAKLNFLIFAKLLPILTKTTSHYITF